MSLQSKFDQVIARYSDLESKLSNSDIDNEERINLGREYSDLIPIVEAIEKLKSVQGEIKSLEEIISDEETDIDMNRLADEELNELKNILPNLEQKVKLLLLHKDEADDRNAILEIRPGTGGDEDAHFAGDLAR